MDEKICDRYYSAYLKALNKIEEIYNQNTGKCTDEQLRKMICSEYRKKHLDPDGIAVRSVFGIECTADGIHSMCRICAMEEKVEDILTVFKRYRAIPIFFFPREIERINTSRARVFKDRIDHTLYDLKMYYTDKKNECRLFKTYSRQKTKMWLENMQSFENIIDWWRVKGIFTDSQYNVYDLELGNDCIITEYRRVSEYREQWSRQYYENLKEKIEKVIHM